ncbi:hypothetical protein GCM10009069_05590 [Algimonas arctica]|uniref:Organic solvent tolerance-like N-terminal domain-containing protein n=1 Tax=Algimonas arctica TaxID=1479486 RepID=A0A8J3CLV6_9PROT|nr:hypothetical protein [Algimonas arctica]GHA85335.1 hypothetical protein GCM10009069_05590 [Algimonas arctica]
MFSFKETLLSAAFLSAMTVSPAFAQQQPAPALMQGSSHVGLVSGNVIIKRSGEFSVAQNSSAVLDGDVVMTLEGGSASVTLANGCAVDLLAEQSVLVKTSEDRCDSALVIGDSEFYSQEIGGGLSSALIGQLFAAAVVTGMVVAIASDGADNPTSP